MFCCIWISYTRTPVQDTALRLWGVGKVINPFPTFQKKSISKRNWNFENSNFLQLPNILYFSRFLKVFLNFLLNFPWIFSKLRVLSLWFFYWKTPRILKRKKLNMSSSDYLLRANACNKHLKAKAWAWLIWKNSCNSAFSSLVVALNMASRSLKENSFAWMCCRSESHLLSNPPTHRT